MTHPPDHDQRQAAIRERRRNVWIDAGAGTGKTSTLVARLVNLVAPIDGSDPLPLDRIAVLTFTRRAAGELKLRIREELLSCLATPSIAPARRRLLADALSQLDSAYVGTIHSFADRLLRRVPVEAHLSPQHEILEDDTALLDESFQQLLHGCEHGTLTGLLAGSNAESRAVDVMEMMATALRCGVLTRTRETERYSSYGLDVLFTSLVRTRDVSPVETEPPRLDLDRLRGNMREFIEIARRACGASNFAHWLRATARRIEQVFQEEDPAILFSDVAAPIFDKRRSSRRPKKGTDCDGDEELWRAWKILDVGAPHRDTGAAALGDELTIPLHTWLGHRLVRAAPVFVSLCERVKRKLGVLDNVDLLLKLRDLLRFDKLTRRRFQLLFKHILVDEFQDTDPLQSEILLFLCERGQSADRWEEIEVEDGRLTLVGDPKQSIYRFRRADIAMYETMRERVAPTALSVRLQTNFRSSPSLIQFFNDRFRSILGTGSPDDDFDAASGAVFHRDLVACGNEASGVAVHVVPLDLGLDMPDRAADYRRLEGEATALYLRWLVEESGFKVRDPSRRVRRNVGFGDIAVLATATTELHHLLRHLDGWSVPHAARGGRLLLQDPIHQQFLLGLRRLSDPFDGVAEAAILRPPFFAIDLRDVVAQRFGGEGGSDAAARVERALELIGQLRSVRNQRSAGATARALLDRTGFGRRIAVGPNGRERLERLRDLCHLLDELAADRGLDFDSTTALVRGWVTDPPRLDGPAPMIAESVQVLTVHQAKGLEFPVVVLWDGKAPLRATTAKPPWKIDRVGGSWELALEGLHCSHPAGTDLAGSECSYLDQERRRLLYVACTRARDLLVIPQVGGDRSKTLYGGLLAGEFSPHVHILDAYLHGEGASWVPARADSPATWPPESDDLQATVDTHWAEALRQAGTPRRRPLAVTRQAAPNAEAEVDKDRAGRFGALFGTIVHAAISASLRQPEISPHEAVAHVGSSLLSEAQAAEAVADVERSVTALREAGLTGADQSRFQLEYPVAGAGDDGTLLVGSIDLVVDTPHGLHVLDFKTDDPGDNPRAIAALYSHQLRTYRDLLAAGGLGGGLPIRCGLLLTATGSFHWL